MYPATLCIVLPTYNPEMSGLAHILHRRDSRVSMKSKQDEGQPCLVPFKISKDSLRVPLTLMDAEEKEYRTRIQVNKEGPGPTGQRTVVEKGQLFLSDVFSKSIDMATRGMCLN